MSEDDDLWRPLGLEEAPAHFASASQKARIATEEWARRVGCPNCGSPVLARLPNNSPVADLRCDVCRDEYELKSTRLRFGPRVPDGAYKTMLQRLASPTNPHLMLLAYDPEHHEATDILVIPNHFFVPDMIEPRPPLAATARRAGWVGCNINISRVPAIGRVTILRDRHWSPREAVRRQWESARFLRNASPNARGWLVEVLRTVEDIGLSSFTLDDVYAGESRLQALFPNNRNVRPKIRQQLQVLRDNGLLEFLGGGKYRLRRES